MSRGTPRFRTVESISPNLFRMKDVSRHFDDPRRRRANVSELVTNSKIIKEDKLQDPTRYGAFRGRGLFSRRVSS